MFPFLKIFLLLFVTLTVGGFAYLALTDLPVRQSEVVVDIEVAQ